MTAAKIESAARLDLNLLVRSLLHEPDWVLEWRRKTTHLAKRDISAQRARMADYFYAVSEPDAD